MITEGMKKHLLTVGKNPDKTVKNCVYNTRMQKRITRELDMLYWLCKNRPDVFLDEERESHDESGIIMSHRRLKKLLLCVKHLNPKIEVELVLKNLDFPDETS